MASNVTNTGSVSQPSLNAIIHPSLNTLLISHTFSTLLIPLTFALFFFSTSQSRSRLLFSLNLVAIIIAFLLGVLVDAYTIHAILEPLNPWSLAYGATIDVVGIFLSIIIDLTLLVRLVSVYPLSYLGLVRFSLLIAIPILLKGARVLNIAFFIKLVVENINNPDAVVTSGLLYLKIEWWAQMVDNAYASLTFLWKMRYHGTSRVMTNSSRVTLAQRMHTVFCIALATFVVPAMFSVVQLVSIYRNVNVIIMDQITFVNLMVATFGLASATAWAGNINRQETQIVCPKHDTHGRVVGVFGLGTKRAVSDSLVNIHGSDSAYAMSSREN